MMVKVFARLGGCEDMVNCSFKIGIIGPTEKDDQEQGK